MSFRRRWYTACITKLCFEPWDADPSILDRGDIELLSVASTTVRMQTNYFPTPSAHVPMDKFCSVARALELLADAWTFLVLRESFFGARRFEQFQRVLTVPRNTLVNRLTTLVDVGLLKRVAVGPPSARFEYRFTHMGIELFPTMLAMLRYGDDWLQEKNYRPIQLRHSRCGKECSPEVVCSECKEPVHMHQVQFRPGPGSGGSLREQRSQRSRRASDPKVFERGRPCSVAKTLQVIGDRWSILLLREMQLGVRRFDEFQANLGIASNILTNRLLRMLQYGIIEKHAYQHRPERFEYRFTPKGRDLYGAIIVILRWGDKWVSGGRPPLLLRHKLCQKDFSALVVCSECREELLPHEVSYTMNYELGVAKNNDVEGLAEGEALEMTETL